MSRRDNPVDIILNIIKIAIVVIIGYIIIKALLQAAS